MDKKGSAKRSLAGAAAACAAVLLVLAMWALPVQKGAVPTESIRWAAVAGALTGGLAAMLVGGSHKGAASILAGLLPAAVLLAVSWSVSGREGTGSLPIICAVCLLLPSAAAQLRRRGNGKRRARKRRH